MLSRRGNVLPTVGTCDNCHVRRVNVWPAANRRYDSGLYCAACWEEYCAEETNRPPAALRSGDPLVIADSSGRDHSPILPPPDNNFFQMEAGRDFEYPNMPPEDVQCTICLNPWVQPVEFGPCGHVFCRKCSEDYTRHNPSRIDCPQCRSTVAVFKAPSRIILGILDSLRMRCLKCGWDGSRDQYVQHLASCTPRHFAVLCREWGDKELKHENFREALAQYTKGIASLAKLSKSKQKGLELHVLFSRRSDVLLRLDRHQEACSDASNAIRLEPSFTKAYFCRYKANKGLKKSLAELQTGLGKILELEPENEFAVAERSHLDAGSSKKEKAELENIGDLLCDAEKTKTEGNSAFGAGDLTVAIAHYAHALNQIRHVQELLRSQGNTAEVSNAENISKANFLAVACYSNRAQSYIKTNKWVSASKDARCALEVDRKHVKSWYRLAYSLTQQSGHRTEALSVCMEALQVDPTNTAILELKDEIEVWMRGLGLDNHEMDQTGLFESPGAPHVGSEAPASQRTKQQKLRVPINLGLKPRYANSIDPRNLPAFRKEGARRGAFEQAFQDMFSLHEIAQGNALDGELLCHEEDKIHASGGSAGNFSLRWELLHFGHCLDGMKKREEARIAFFFEEHNESRGVSLMIDLNEIVQTADDTELCIPVWYGVQEQRNAQNLDNLKYLVRNCQSCAKQKCSGRCLDQLLKVLEYHEQVLTDAYVLQSAENRRKQEELGSLKRSFVAPLSCVEPGDRLPCASCKQCYEELKCKLCGTPYCSEACFAAHSSEHMKQCQGNLLSLEPLSGESFIDDPHVDIPMRSSPQMASVHYTNISLRGSKGSIGKKHKIEELDEFGNAKGKLPKNLAEWTPDVIKIQVPLAGVGMMMIYNEDHTIEFHPDESVIGRKGYEIISRMIRRHGPMGLKGYFNATVLQKNDQGKSEPTLRVFTTKLVAPPQW